MQYLRANLSRKVGRLVDWSGGFWERRYSAEPVLDDEALVGRLRYVLAHGVKEGHASTRHALRELREQYRAFVAAFREAAAACRAKSPHTNSLTPSRDTLSGSMPNCDCGC
jgi:hypothetical protein